MPDQTEPFPDCHRWPDQMLTLIDLPLANQRGELFDSQLKLASLVGQLVYERCRAVKQCRLVDNIGARLGSEAYFRSHK